MDGSRARTSIREHYAQPRRKVFILYSLVFTYASHGLGRAVCRSSNCIFLIRAKIFVDLIGRHSTFIQSLELVQRRRLMRVMVIVKATKDSEAGGMPSKELVTAMG